MFIKLFKGGANDNILKPLAYTTSCGPISKLSLLRSHTVGTITENTDNYYP
jgi:hypothetical protein